MTRYLFETCSNELCPDGHPVTRGIYKSQVVLNALIESHPPVVGNLADLEVREYREADKEACRRLWKELTIKHRQIYNDPEIGGPDPGLHFDKHLEAVKPEQLMVAVADGEVVGLVGYLVLGEEEVEVEPIVVAESHRGKGIGSLLLDAVVSKFEGTGIKFLDVRPVLRNVKALEFFRKRGFDKLGRIELFIDYSDREWKKGLQIFDLDFEY